MVSRGRVQVGSLTMAFEWAAMGRGFDESSAVGAEAPLGLNAIPADAHRSLERSEPCDIPDESLSGEQSERAWASHRT